MMNVAILSDQSLLTQGIISRLHNSAPSINVQMVELGQPAVVEKLLAIQPDVIILESKELSNNSFCPLNHLFAAFPHLVVMEVNIETSDIQIIRSSQYAASGIGDMLTMLQDAYSPQSGVVSSM
jgi:chemotaxis response regulator CheB